MGSIQLEKYRKSITIAIPIIPIVLMAQETTKAFCTGHNSKLKARPQSQMKST
jgi:hypothetical protein